ncbi:MAG: hypothetical protein AB2L24_11620 [Mangrovibacterium sp.]
MKKQSRKSRIIGIQKREYETLTRDQLAYKFLIEAISETRAEDQLVRILQKSSIKSNL